MKNYNRDLLLLYKTEVYSEDLLQHEVECLHQILLQVERNDVFCGLTNWLPVQKLQANQKPS